MLLAISFALLSIWIFAGSVQSKLHLRSPELTVAFAWFVSQGVLTLICLILCNIFVCFTSQVLQKSACLVLAALSISKLVEFGNRRETSVWSSFSSRELLRAAGLGLLLLLVSEILLCNHLALQDGQIMYTNAFWDISVHYTAIQSFVFGDNFPPQNEGRAGLPMTYHFLHSLLVAIYSALGLDLVAGINFVTIVSLAALLLLIVGICKEFLFSRLAGLLTVFLFLTSSSLRFLDEAMLMYYNGVGIVFSWSYFTPIAPFYFSVFQKDNSYLYNGNHHNFFYLIAERHQIFALGFALCALVAVLRRRFLDSRDLVVYGFFFGTLAFWHIFIASAFAVALLLFTGLYWRDRKLRSFLCAFGTSYVWQFLYVLAGNTTGKKMVSRAVVELPLRAPEFEAALPVRWWHILRYQAFNYGFKLPVLAPSLSALFRRCRQMAAFMAISIVLLVTVISVLDRDSLLGMNFYKWFKCLDLMLDFFVGYYLTTILTDARRIVRCMGWLLLPLLTLSGSMELVFYMTQKPQYPFVAYPSAFVNDLRANSNPKDVFVGRADREILLAGRKMFLADKQRVGYYTSFFMGDYVTRERRAVIQKLYGAKTAAEFCALAAANGIDYVEFDSTRWSDELYAQLRQWPQFETYTEMLGWVKYVGTAGCRNTANG